jgi:DNA repair protein RadA
LAEKDCLLKDLPGIGEKTALKLRDMGVSNIHTLAVTPYHEIQSNTDIKKDRIRTMLSAAREKMDWSYVTGLELLEKEKTKRVCTTGCQELDDILGGGIRTQEMTEFYGEYGTGKSSICFKLCVTAPQPPEQGGLGGPVLFYDTEDTFSSHRIQQICKAMELDPEPILSGIIISKVYTSDHQELLLDHGFQVCEEEGVKLVIVDSVITHYRSEYIGRESLAERQQRLNKYLSRLKRLARIYNLAVVITNQAQADPTPWYMGGGRPKGTGGHVLAHTPTHRVYIRRSSKSKRVAKMEDSPYLPQREAAFKLSDQGVEDL